MPWTMIIPPGGTPRAARARATSAESGYDTCSDRCAALLGLR